MTTHGETPPQKSSLRSLAASARDTNVRRAPFRVLVVDLHPVVRLGVIAMLDPLKEFHVVGQSGEGHAAVDKALHLEPDLVLLDLELPDLDGTEVIRRVSRKAPKIRIVVFTAVERDDCMLDAIQSGAHGYLLKDAKQEEFVRALNVVRRGGTLIEPMLAAKLFRRLGDEGPALTSREFEVLELVSEGHPNRVIAEALGVTERTVKFHVSSILSKLGASNRTEAAALARNRGLLQE